MSLRILPSKTPFSRRYIDITDHWQMVRFCRNFCPRFCKVTFFCFCPICKFRFSSAICDLRLLKKLFKSFARFSKFCIQLHEIAESQILTDSGYGGCQNSSKDSEKSPIFRSQGYRVVLNRFRGHQSWQVDASHPSARRRMPPKAAAGDPVQKSHV